MKTGIMEDSYIDFTAPDLGTKVLVLLVCLTLGAW